MSWPNKPLGIVAEFIRGITYKPEELVENFSQNSVVCMRTKNVQEILDQGDLLSIPERLIKRREQFLQEGDLLVSSANSFNLVGKACWVGKLNYAATAGGFISILRPKVPELDRKFLFYWITSEPTQNSLRLCGRQTTNISNLSFDRAEQLQIPLPPLPIQKKIAAVLEKADELRRKREEQIKRLDDLLQATFLDMFGDIFNDSKCIEKAEFGQFIRSIRYGTGSPPEFSQTGIPFIRATNVKERTIKSQGMAFISAEEARKIEKCRVSEGDLIIVRSGANTGDCARIPKAFDQAYGGYDLIIEIDEPYSSFYNYFFSTPSARLVIDGLSRRAGQPHLNAEQVKTFPVLVPVDSDMQKFVKILIETEKMAESIVSRQKIHANLFNSLMQRAFKGELDLK
jgi:type I restriction enzyme S subunit